MFKDLTVDQTDILVLNTAYFTFFSHVVLAHHARVLYESITERCIAHLFPASLPQSRCLTV